MLEVIFEVPQGSIVRSLLFNIFYLFFVIEDTNIASYADDNTPYFRADNINGDTIKSLEEASEILFKWLNDNLRKSDVDKCHLSVSIKQYCLNKNRKFCEKLLGVKFAHKLSFDDRISELCKKASIKIHYHSSSLSRVTSYMNISIRVLS